MPEVDLSLLLNIALFSTFGFYSLLTIRFLYLQQYMKGPQIDQEATSPPDNSHKYKWILLIHTITCAVICALALALSIMSCTDSRVSVLYTGVSSSLICSEPGLTIARFYLPSQIF